MDLEATAQALVTETALPEQVAATETVEAEPDYGAAFDKAMGEAPAEAGNIAPEPVEAEQAPEPTPEAVEAPTDVPVALRKHWSGLPEEARDAVLNAQREMSRKLSDMGRQVQGIAPIRDVLLEAARDNPAIMNMRPDELARDVMRLAQISAQFNQNPVGAFQRLAEEKGLTEALRKHYGGQAQEAQQTVSLQNEIRALKQQLARAADPEFIREQVSAVTTQERVVSEVQAFASTKEHWSDVESVMPDFIKTAKNMAPELSAKDTLEFAYDLAFQALQRTRPDLKAKAQAAVEAAVAPDPERAKAALQAKSINVTGRASGQARELTEEERYAAAYDRASRK